MFKLLAGCWIGFTIGTIIYAGARYIFTKSTGDVLAIWWGATSMALIILYANHLKK